MMPQSRTKNCQKGMCSSVTVTISELMSYFMNIPDTPWLPAAWLITLSLSVTENWWVSAEILYVWSLVGTTVIKYWNIWLWSECCAWEAGRLQWEERTTGMCGGLGSKQRGAEVKMKFSLRFANRVCVFLFFFNGWGWGLRYKRGVNLENPKDNSGVRWSPSHTVGRSFCLL